MRPTESIMATTPSPRTVSTYEVEIGVRIVAARRRAGVTQTELARAVGVSQQQQLKYEKGRDRLSVGRLVQIAEALGANPVTLFPLFVADSSSGEKPLLRSPSTEERDFLLALRDLSPHLRSAFERLIDTCAAGRTRRFATSGLTLP